MKKLLLICCLAPTVLFAQDESTWKLFSAEIGISYSRFWDIDKLPNIQDIVKDPSAVEGGSAPYFSWGYYYPYGSFRFANSSANYSLQVGFTPKKESRTVNFGLSYSRYSQIPRRSITDYTTTIIDTMQITHSTGDQETWLVDSTWFNEELYFQNLQVVSLSADYVFRTKRRMLSAYAGGGLQLGASVVSKVYNSSTQMASYRYVDTNGYEISPYGPYSYQQQYGYTYVPSEIIDYESQELKAKMAFILTPYLPIGIEITPFIDRKWLGKISIDINAKVGAEMRFMNGADPYIRPLYSFGTGLKYFF